MADVSCRPSSIRDPNRGQLLLLSALGLATLLVMLTLVLNSAIYTEIEASSESAALESADVLSTQYEALSVTSTAVDVENEGGHRTYEAMNANLTRHIDSWTDLSAQHAAVTARSVTLQLNSTVNGTRLIQDDDRSMTNINGGENWTPVDAATDTRSFAMDVKRNSLVDVGDSDTNATVLLNQDVFSVAVENDSGRWRTFVYRDGSEIVIRVADPAGDLGQACRKTTATVTIDFAVGTVDGTACDDLPGLTTEQTPVEIAFRNGASAGGTYEIIVDSLEIDGDVADAGDLPPGSELASPYGERLIYAVTVDFDFASPGLTYSAVLDVSGGEGL